jgi:hypothetical protein
MIEIARHREDQAPEKSKWLTYLPVLLIFLPFLILAVIYLKFSLQSIFVRNDTTYPEGAYVYTFLTALQTGKLYSSPFEFPFNSQLYGPVFYLVGLVFAKVAHGDAMLTTQLWRTLSFLSFLGSAGLIGFLSWKLEKTKRWVAVSVVLSLACPLAIGLSASARPDLLSIFLILGALTVYEAARGRTPLIVWAGVLGSLSCLTKQSTAPILLALAIDCLIARRLRNFAALVAAGIPVPAIIFSTLWLRHEPFLPNLFIMKHAVFSWHWMVITVIDTVRTTQIAVIPISLSLLGAALSWRKERYRTILLVGAFAWIVNLAALGNTGSGPYYLILPWLLTVLLMPAGLIRLEEWSRRSILIPSGLILLGGLLLIHQTNVLIPKLRPDLDTSNLIQVNMLSSNPYLELHSRRPQLLDPYLYHQLSLQNVWSVAPILQQIDAEKYDLIVIWGDDGQKDSDFQVSGYHGTAHWGADTLGEILSHYRALCEVPGSLALVPRDRSGVLDESYLSRIFRQPCRATNRVPRLMPGVR